MGQSMGVRRVLSQELKVLETEEPELKPEVSKQQTHSRKVVTVETQEATQRAS